MVLLLQLVCPCSRVLVALCRRVEGAPWEPGAALASILLFLELDLTLLSVCCSSSAAWKVLCSLFDVHQSGGGGSDPSVWHEEGCICHPYHAGDIRNHATSLVSIPTPCGIYPPSKLPPFSPLCAGDGAVGAVPPLGFCSIQTPSAKRLHGAEGGNGTPGLCRSRTRLSSGMRDTEPTRFPRPLCLRRRE